jgi:polyribonucleotide nucleotidyltransferase
MKVEKSIELGGRKLTLTSGTLAEQASAAVLAQYGETVVLATVVAAPLKVDLGYFPLTVDYQERLYAGGRIKGSRWVKKEGRPTDDEILSARLIDRSIRPLFPASYKMEVQVIVTVMSVDMENDPSILSAIAVSAALTASSLPWEGPVSVLKVGRKDGAFIVNPTIKDLETSDMDLVVSNTKDAMLMLEAGAREVAEEDILNGIDFARKESVQVLSLIEDFAKEIGHKKEEVPADLVTPKLLALVKKLLGAKFDELVKGMALHEGTQTEYEDLKKSITTELKDEDPSAIAIALDQLVREKAREIILAGTRLDGRKHDEIRKLTALVGVLPRVHGSAIFSRGQTQVMSIATLGAPSMGMIIETAEGEETKRYMHQYSMPPYATGETGRVGNPSRREIGHGALAERALMPVIPSLAVFPYTIRVVSEVMSSNGSTSMASTCGSTLSLMDAGVPLTSPVSGIAMGLVIEDDKKFAILSDIMGIEDHMGDMDFKVTGTEKGVTAMQMDVKSLHLTPEILKAAIKQAKEGRAFILKAMLEALPEPRTGVSAFAPKIKVVKVPVEKIGEVIGPGGKIIKKIIAETGAQVEVEDDGSVNISGMDLAMVDKAVAWVESLVKEVKAGEIYEGTVVRIQPFGAFIEVLPGKDGMVHVSDMAEGFVSNPEDIVHIGDKVQVRVKEIDELGRINLSMLLDPAKDKEKAERRQTAPSTGGFSGDRGPRRFDRGTRGGDSGRRFGGPPMGRSSGPHFPASRYFDQGKKDDFSR